MANEQLQHTCFAFIYKSFYLLRFKGEWQISLCIQFYDSISTVFFLFCFSLIFYTPTQTVPEWVIQQAHIVDLFLFFFFILALMNIFFTITSFFVSSSVFFLRIRRTSMLSLKISLKKGIAGTWLTLLFPRPWFNPRSNSISWWPPWWVLVPISSDASFQMNSSRLVRTKYVTPPLPSPPQHTRGGDPEGLAKGCAPFPVFSPSCLATFFSYFFTIRFFPFFSLFLSYPS